MAETVKPGTLYVVATPIGHLGDLSTRAAAVLCDCDRILAEDTRHTARLLDHLGVRRAMTSVHEHNEQSRLQDVLGWLEKGQALALVSDAGTPLISDPGFVLVRAARRHGYAVTTTPGPCAVTAALSVSGLPMDRFVFEGFPPSRRGQRQRFLEGLAREERTLVFYESPRRVAATLRDMVAVFGGQRDGVVVRELTKAYESVYADTLANLVARCDSGDMVTKGEFVLIVAGADKAGAAETASVEAETLLVRLLGSVSVREAVRITSDLTGAGRNQLYERALTLQNSGQ